jgi:hypothetical protein
MCKVNLLECDVRTILIVNDLWWDFMKRFVSNI